MKRKAPRPTLILAAVGAAFSLALVLALVFSGSGVTPEAPRQPLRAAPPVPPVPSPFTGARTPTPPPAPVPATSPEFGIADSAGAFGGYSRRGTNAFNRLKDNLPLRRVRFFVPYDTLATWNGSSCVPSYDYVSHANGGSGSAWATLVAELRAAKLAGLTPELAIAEATLSGRTGAIMGGTRYSAEPTTPEPSYGTSAATPFANWTTAGYEYSCGVSWLTYHLWADSPLGWSAPTQWEAWNEPNGAFRSNSNGGGYNGPLRDACATADNQCEGIYNSDGALCGAPDFADCGPMEAGELWLITQYWADYWKAHVTGFPTYEIAALTLSNAYGLAYLDAYAGALLRSVSCRAGYYCLPSYPSIWAVHDYGDTTSGKADTFGDIDAFTSELARRVKPAQVWITETGTVLTSRTTHDANRPAGCAGERDNNDTFGACVDGNPTAQANGATTFLHLAGRNRDVPITEVFWYQYQATNGNTSWDSGMLAPPFTPPGRFAYGSPDGVYGSDAAGTGLRQSYCVLARLASSSCSGSPIEAADWSFVNAFLNACMTAGARKLTGVQMVSGSTQSSIGQGDELEGPGIQLGTRVIGGLGTRTWRLSEPTSATTCTRSPYGISTAG